MLPYDGPGAVKSIWEIEYQTSYTPCAWNRNSLLYILPEVRGRCETSVTGAAGEGDHVPAFVEQDRHRLA